MNILGFHHVAIIASNYEISKKFYTEVLNFQVIAENFREDRNSYKLDLSGPGDIQLELFSFPNSPKRTSNPEACGLRHLAFAVKDLLAEVDYLKNMQILTEPIRVDEFTGKKFTFFQDPDGLPLELYEVSALVDNVKCEKSYV